MTLGRLSFDSTASSQVAGYVSGGSKNPYLSKHWTNGVMIGAQYGVNIFNARSFRLANADAPDSCTRLLLFSIRFRIPSIIGSKYAFLENVLVQSLEMVKAQR